LRQAPRIASNNSANQWHQPHPVVHRTSSGIARGIRMEPQHSGEQQAMTKAATLIAFILVFIPTGASAKDTQFWNLTANTITSLQLSSTGKNEWGRNQADNDKDHTVDHDERLKITDTASGTYDVKIVDKSGRTCVVPNIQVKAGSIFSIEEKNLKDCTK
jgi:hypothetical protein